MHISSLLFKNASDSLNVTCVCRFYETTRRTGHKLYPVALAALLVSERKGKRRTYLVRWPTTVTEIANRSRQKQIHHGKNKFITAKTNSSPGKNKWHHGKNQMTGQRILVSGAFSRHIYINMTTSTTSI